MLKHISSIWEYRDFLKSEEIILDRAQRIEEIARIMGGDDHSAVSAVSDQEICSLSQQKAGFSAIPQELQKSRHLFFCFDFYQRIRRTAGTERTVPVHGFII